MNPRWASVCALAWIASCAAPDGQRFHVAAAPTLSPHQPARSAPRALAAPAPASAALRQSFTGYPWQNNYGIVWVQASFYTNHADLLEEDLIDEERIIPIVLKVGTRGEGMEVSQVSLTPETMNLQLYLEDGTALKFIPSSEVERRIDDEARDQVLENALRLGLLDQWDSTKGGFVFFEIPGDAKIEVDGTRVEHVANGVRRSMDVARSLIGLTIQTPDGSTRPMFVGVEPTRRVL